MTAVPNNTNSLPPEARRVDGASYWRQPAGAGTPSLLCIVGDQNEKALPPAVLAAVLRDDVLQHAGLGTLRRFCGEWFLWRDGGYRRLSRDALVREIREALRHFRVIHTKNEGGTVVLRVVVNKALTAEVEAALIAERDILLPDELPVPSWLDESSAIDCRDVVVARNGVVDLRSGELRAPSPNLFALNVLDAAWVPDSPPPCAMLDFLASIFGEDEQSKMLVQEWVGLMCVSDTRYQKLLLLIGPPRSGKGVLLRLIRAILGPSNWCAPTLSSLSERFGLASLMNKSAATIDDARLSGRSDLTAITERLLTITGEGELTVARKYLSDVEARLPVRFTIASNEVPRLPDASAALASRFLVLRFTESFLDREDLELDERLADERDAILRWAVEGLRRLRRRGRFVQPEAGRVELDTLDELGSPVRAFVRERCVLLPTAFTSGQALYEGFVRWAVDEGVTRPPTRAVFSRDINAAFPGLRNCTGRPAGSAHDASPVRGWRGISLMPRAGDPDGEGGGLPCGP